jgi:hypothetical protein
MAMSINVAPAATANALRPGKPGTCLVELLVGRTAFLFVLFTRLGGRCFDRAVDDMTGFFEFD